MGSPGTTTPSSPPSRNPLITMDVAVSHFLHTLFKPILPTFIFLLLECSADFRFSFPVSLSFFLASPSLSSVSVPLILGLLLDLVLIGLIKLTFRRARPQLQPQHVPRCSRRQLLFPKWPRFACSFLGVSLLPYSAKRRRICFRFHSTCGSSLKPVLFY